MIWWLMRSQALSYLVRLVFGLLAMMRERERQRERERERERGGGGSESKRE